MILDLLKRCFVCTSSQNTDPRLVPSVGASQKMDILSRGFGFSNSNTYYSTSLVTHHATHISSLLILNPFLGFTFSFMEVKCVPRIAFTMFESLSFLSAQKKVYDPSILMRHAASDLSNKLYFSQYV